MAYVGQGGQYRPVEDGSSPSALSSPPRSPENPTPPNYNQMHQRDKTLGVFATAQATSPTAQLQAATNPPPNINLTAKGLPRKKPGRKPKDPNAPPTQPAKPRKRVKTSDPVPPTEATAAPVPVPAAVPVTVPGPKQSKITDLVGTIQVAPHQPVSKPPTAPITSSNVPGGHSRDSLPNHSTSTLGHSIPPTVPATPRPASSGQIFDPVRGSTVPVETSHHVVASHPPVSPSHQSQIVNRASASPSIKSLIDPTPSIPQAQSRLVPPTSVTSAPVSPVPVYKSQPSVNPFTGPSGSNILSSTQNVPAPAHYTPMDPYGPSNISAIKKPEAPSTAPSSSAPTPPSHPLKAPRAKEAPPPLPTGSGLLSATPFGPGSAPNGAAPDADTATDIYLTFALKGKQNTTINFAREVERKYGFAALHPRLAARQERQRALAAAGAALEREMGAAAPADPDDMSLDALSEGASDDDGKGGGAAAGDETGSAAGTGADAPKKRRRRRVEEYDRSDDFIDDTELLWEESALMAKDGFFVYSGPLVVEGAKLDVERSDGSVAKRGRGRGRGGAARGDAAARGARGAGRGSRGGATVRKPRVTKADRALMELEKIEREKMAATLAAKPPTAVVGQPPVGFALGGVAS